MTSNIHERKINNRNIIFGIVLMIACAYVGAISTIPNQTAIVTTIVNAPSHVIPQNAVSEASVNIALQSNTGVINAIPEITLIVKIIIIIGIVIFVFSLLSMTGLVPQFGGMGD